VQSVRYCKSIIRSRASLTYDAAQQRIDSLYDLKTLPNANPIVLVH